MKCIMEPRFMWEDIEEDRDFRFPAHLPTVNAIVAAVKKHVGCRQDSDTGKVLVILREEGEVPRVTTLDDCLLECDGQVALLVDVFGVINFVVNND